MRSDFSPLFQSALKQIAGLNPSAWLAVDRGFVREEYKSLCFGMGLGVSAEGLVNPKQFAQKWIPESEGRLLEITARVELLRLLFKKTEVRSILPVLAEHRFRPRFFEGLDFSLQQGRLLFAHAEEARVVEERLRERLGASQKRDEFFILNQLWEKTLELKQLWDEPRLYEDAGQAINSSDKKMFLLTHFQDAPRMQFFWNEVARKISLERIPSQLLRVKNEGKYKIKRKQAHSLEDAVQFLFDEILASGDLENHAIVIQDEPEIRRTFKRVMEQRGLELNDPRDPTLLVQSEELKLALLELELVSKNFSSSLVLSWMKYQADVALDEQGEFRKKMIEGGIQTGIKSYSFLPKLFAKLTEIQSRYPSRIHFNAFETSVMNSAQAHAVSSWVRKALEKVFSDWKSSLLQLELEERVRPLRYWLEMIQEKLRRAKPQASPVKYRGGIQLYRVDQAPNPLLDPSQIQVHFLGVGVSFFEPREEGNDWFSAREQEVLSKEFGLVSYQEIQKNRSESFLNWASLSQRSSAHALFWEFLYDEEGNEAESTELQLTLLPDLEVSEPESIGVHPSLQKSMHTELSVQSGEVSIALPKNEWPISFLNAYGNCPFVAYSSYCLSLYDERETDFELTGDSFGNLIHAALEILVKEKTTADDAFEQAWKKKRPIAWLKSDRLFRAIRNKSVTLLREFEKSEADYRARSGAEVLALEMDVKWSKEGLEFKGRLDRVDQHSDGLVLMDYKTSASLPTGKETLEKGMGLQLPIYAFALKEKLNQEVVTAQYLHLTQHKVNRNIGILFQRWNQSKISDPVKHAVTNARSTSQSILTEEPDVIWAKLDAKVKLILDQLKRGDFSANPADPTDCKTCRYSLVCGKKRGSSESASEHGSEGVGSAPDA